MQKRLVFFLATAALMPGCSFSAKIDNIPELALLAVSRSLVSSSFTYSGATTLMNVPITRTRASRCLISFSGNNANCIVDGATLEVLPLE